MTASGGSPLADGGVREAKNFGDTPTRSAVARGGARPGAVRGQRKKECRESVERERVMTVTVMYVSKVWKTVL
ncbi:hypothetical protein M6B38_242340 [Iris pallida]|uniref:Uncharacterized protein n=1 Tax=Iris pallida TaxID=29817 RepID=A0AAX6DJH5_IRIPA|nr:hypothetical protein M6B38_242340 [Iris pallida]